MLLFHAYQLPRTHVYRLLPSNGQFRLASLFRLFSSHVTTYILQCSFWNYWLTHHLVRVFMQKERQISATPGHLQVPIYDNSRKLLYWIMPLYIKLLIPFLNDAEWRIIYCVLWYTYFLFSFLSEMCFVDGILVSCNVSRYMLYILYFMLFDI
jgi:hypothetical protein